MKNKWTILIMLILFAITILIVNYTGKRPPSFPGAQAILHDENGKSISIVNLNGTVRIVSYFKTWCRECRAEAKELEALQQAVGGESKLSVFLISDEDAESITMFRKITNVHLPVLFSNKDLTALNIRRFPTTYLLDKNNKIIDAKVESIYWNTPEMQVKIKQLNR